MKSHDRASECKHEAAFHPVWIVGRLTAGALRKVQKGAFTFRSSTLSQPQFDRCPLVRLSGSPHDTPLLFTTTCSPSGARPSMAAASSSLNYLEQTRSRPEDTSTAQGSRLFMLASTLLPLAEFRAAMLIEWERVQAPAAQT